MSQESLPGDGRSCQCGSGLRPSRCCALQGEALPPPAALRHLLPLAERARLAFKHGQVQTAEQLCIEVLELAPGQPAALEILYRLRRTANRTRAAETLLERLVQLHPNRSALRCELGTFKLRKGDYAAAEQQARNAIRLSPLDVGAHALLAAVLADCNRAQAAEFHYLRVLELSGKRTPDVLASLAGCLKAQGRMEEARALFEEAVAADPENLRALLGWARLEEADRDLAAADRLLTRAEAVRPDDAGVRLTRAVLHTRLGHPEEALRVLDTADRPDGAGEADALDQHGWLERGRALDRLGRYDEAFAAFAEAKRRARAQGTTYSEGVAQDMARRLTSFFNAQRLAFTPRVAAPAPGPRPIFVLGFPRSGTTLVEQTLSAHPAIRAGDELPTISDIAISMQQVLGGPHAYPEALAELWMGDRRDGLEAMRDLYLRRARQYGAIDATGADPAAWFTDKMPLNEMHLGLIALLFPQAPLIHVRRHPLDVVLSVFGTHLTHGFRCAFDLETIARHYVLVADLVEHYRTEMALRYLPIRYEDMVGDQEATVRRMLAFVGEPFDPACLRFNENRRHARTASYAQVTEALYPRSVHRYRHYRSQLEGLLPILAPTIERLGYHVAWEDRLAVAA